jgi:hypothetical protein
MSNDILKIRSSIKSSLLRLILIRGTIIAGVGALFIFLAAAFLTVTLLNTWGFLILCLAVSLIGIGMIPYRKLTRLEKKPYEIIAEDNSKLHFKILGNPAFMIPCVSIQNMKYLEKGNIYGIAIFLKRPLTEKILINEQNFDMRKFQKNSQKKYACDLFLPYFSQRSFNELSEFLNRPDEE